MSSKIFLVGNVTKEPECKERPDGNSIVAFGVANNIGKDKTDFYTVSCFGKTGDFAFQYVHKGDKIAVSGRLELRSYKDTAFGNVTADGIDLMSKPKSQEAKQETKADDEDELPF